MVQVFERDLAADSAPTKPPHDRKPPEQKKKQLLGIVNAASRAKEGGTADGEQTEKRFSYSPYRLERQCPANVILFLFYTNLLISFMFGRNHCESCALFSTNFQEAESQLPKTISFCQVAMNARFTER